MITRAHIRRQLRASGGITNVTPREGYFLGSIVRGAKKAVSKVADVVKQVVKSPIGKAAILGLGASYLGPKIMSGGLGNFFKTGIGKFGVQNLGLPGGADMGSTGSGLLGLLSKGKAAIGGMSGGAKLAGGAGLLSYFMSKGASKEEAEDLIKDVYRGEGMGFDQIRADINKYRSGELSQSQMFDKNYRFLTPRNFVGAEGGRVGLRSGSPEEGIKNLKAGALPIKVEGDVRPAEMKMAEIPKGLSMQDAVKTFTLSNGRKPKNVQEVIDFFKNRKLSAQGGRIGYSNGSDYDPEDDRDIMEIMRDEYGTWDQHDADYYSKLKKKKPEEGIKSLEAGALPIKVEGDVRPENMKMAAYRPGKLINVDKMPRKKLVGHLNSMELPETNARDFDDNHIRQILIDFAPDIFTGSWGSNMAQGGRIGKFGGGMGITMPSIPTGMPRVNTGGIRELDYRQSGGFVPVGVKEKADDVPAMLSKNEFVMTADAVKAAGGGSVEKGAQRMYDTMKRLEGKVV